MTLRVVQLSDCHVAADPGEAYRGVNARANLLALLEPVRQWRPDLVLATGDLSEDGSAGSYGWLAEQFHSLATPVLALPGNHDDPVALKHHFPATAFEAPLVLHGESWLVVLLNTAAAGEISGRLGSARLDALDQVLGGNPKPTLIALHHQPLEIGSPWIDRYPLLDPADFWQVLDRHPQVRLVIWGHVHQDCSFERGGVIGLGSPSTASNSLPERECFTHDPTGPACRWLKLETDGAFATGLIHVAQQSLRPGVSPPSG